VSRYEPAMDREEHPLSVEEIDRQLEEILGPPPGPPKPGPRALNAILGSRTHVRIVRVLVAANGTNLTVREIARRAISARGRVLEVLRQMDEIGFLTRDRTPTHLVYRLRNDHPLNTPVRCLFEREQHEEGRPKD
jgi:hypothetical protein